MHPPLIADISEMTSMAASCIDAPVQFVDRVKDEGEIKGVFYFSAFDTDIIEDVIVEILNLLKGAPLQPVAKVAAQVSEKRTIKLLIGLVENIFTHGKVLCCGKMPIFPRLGPCWGRVFGYLDELNMPI